MMVHVKPLTAKFNQEDINQIKALAAIRQVKPSALVRQAVRQFITQNYPAAEIVTMQETA
ncbi:CopG family transcriptional regulator [Trichocoleus sp. FACHB-46]|uniref:Ribbon-helix-helix domain-containing protein n=1 Tax=Trichocoleus desertorum GB2-A4 TaxID=2933944 RepID=A0ABV0JF91_9CYAN|nr:CopG family transcriptional regulator [Trichocoleus sp. FACHB-46]MBD1862349.1 hypothetical protein [Trichocoleus sp. FACHB-46]